MTNIALVVCAEQQPFHCLVTPPGADAKPMAESSTQPDGQNIIIKTPAMPAAASLAPATFSSAEKISMR